MATRLRGNDKEIEGQRWVATTRAKAGEVLGNLSGEIVYPCISDLDGEDEGGQTSSSLAVSTRWISTAKLLQSGLVTLAQMEGGE
ncbi:hypothetical protein GW17_00055907 [Ensete ventricosum]|nr:hypothetical protein GW17_00055907 [Ensete ventricosum]